MDLQTKLKAVRAVVLNVDGVLTDGNLLLLEDGEMLRTMNIKDGVAIKTALKNLLKIAVISSGGSEAIEMRLKNLGIKDIFLFEENKLSAFERFCLDNGIDVKDALYMGDDINDLNALNKAGVSACPSDAADEVKEVCDFVSSLKGGKGCAREIIEAVLKAKNIWLK